MMEKILYKVLQGNVLAVDESSLLQSYGQIGDYIGGIWGTLVGALTLLVVAATWFSTHKINEKTKKYQIFSEILRSHEEIIGSIRIGNRVGRDAFGVILQEFYAAYAAVLVENDKCGRYLTLRQRIDIAYTFTYFGAHTETVDILRKVYHMFSSFDVFKVLSRKKRSKKEDRLNKSIFENSKEYLAEKELWHNSINSGFDLIKRMNVPFSEKQALREILITAKGLPTREMSKGGFIDLAEGLALDSEFGGHQNRLSNYFRNLYSAFTFIQDSGLSKKEKYALAKVFRSKLSNYEQALLALNALAYQGRSWIESGIINEYALVKNIPQYFFIFDDEFSLQEMFPDIDFEWAKKK
ncbi:hypothetical protein IFU01_06545 [Oxalobacteraceae sp. CFBP 8763]|nr:hypothetical protein [Oxalobacteraceae sp. CFBP 8763]